MINIALKDLKILFSDWKAILLTFLLPIVLVTLFAFAFGGVGGKNIIPVITIQYCDFDKSDNSESIIQNLDSHPSIQMRECDLDEGTSEILEGNELAMLVINKGFRDSIQSGRKPPVDLVYDQSRIAEIGIVIGLVSTEIIAAGINDKIVNDLKYSLRNNFPEIEEAVKEIIIKSAEMQYLTKKQKSTLIEELKPEMVELINEQGRSWGLIQAVAGIAVIMLLFSVSARGASLLTEKQSGTLKRLLTAPIPGHYILYGQLIYSIIISLAQLIVMFLFAWVAFGLEIWIDIPAIVIMMFATAFACSSFGIFIASICSSHKQVEIVSIIIILVMSTIGGSMIPLYIMPEFMQELAVFSINYWSIQGFYDIFWRQLPMIYVMPKFIVLMAIGLIMVVISLALYKQNMKKLVS